MKNSSKTNRQLEPRLHKHEFNTFEDVLMPAILIIIWTGNPALGALSSATAAVATGDILWVYQKQQPLTSTILAIVAIDNGLVLILSGFALVSSDIFISEASLSWSIMLIKHHAKIFGSLSLGRLTGALLDVGLNMERIRMTAR